MKTLSAQQLAHNAVESRAVRYFDDALAAHNEIIKLYGSSFEVLTERAITKYFAGDLDGAVGDAREASRLNPRCQRALLFLAVASGKKGDLETALGAYDRLLKIEPRHGIAYTNRALLYQEMGRTQQAFVDYDRAIQSNPADYKAHYNRANLLYSLKRYEESIAAYGAAIAANPTYVMAYTNRGATYLELKLYQEAIEDFTTAIQCEPRAVLPLANRGTARWKNGNRKEGYADLYHAMEVAPFDSFPFRATAEILELEGDWPGAIRYFEMAELRSDTEAGIRAQQLRHKTRTDPNARPPGPEPSVNLSSEDQWLETMEFWIKRLQEDPGARGEAVWKGVPFPEVLAETRKIAAGKDAHALRGMGDREFQTARKAREGRRPRDAAQTLYRAAAFFFLGGDLEHLGVALTNAGAMLAELRHVDSAMRIEHYALELKQLLGSPGENIARSLRVISEMQLVSGEYVTARSLLAQAAYIYMKGGMKDFALRLEDEIQAINPRIYLSTEPFRCELDAPAKRSFATWMADAECALQQDKKMAAMSLHHALAVARHEGNIREQRTACLLLGELLYTEFRMFREAYRHYGAAAVLSARLHDAKEECEARLWQSRASAECGDFASARELLLISLSKLQGSVPSPLRADILVFLSLMCQQLERMDEGRTYLEMSLEEASSLTPVEPGWYLRHAALFRVADLKPAASVVLAYGAQLTEMPNRGSFEMLHGLARLWYDTEDWAKAIEVLQLAIECAEGLGDGDGQRMCWVHLGLAALESQEYDLAIEAKNKARMIQQSSTHDAIERDFLDLEMQLHAIEMSNVITEQNAKKLISRYSAMPDFGRNVARTKIDRLLEAKAPDPVQLADGYCALAILNERSGRTEVAFSELFQGLGTLRRLGLNSNRVGLLEVCGAILLRHGRVRAAWRVFRSAEGVRSRFCPERNPGPTLSWIGECRLRLGERTGASELIASLERSSNLASDWGSPDRRLVLSQLHQRWGDLNAAAIYAAESLKATATAPTSESRACSLAWAAKLAAHQNRMEEAETLATQALEVVETQAAAAPPYDRLDWRRAYASAAEALLAVWHGSSESGAARALALVERIRLRGLLERFGRRLATAPESFPEELQKKERELLGLERATQSEVARLESMKRMRMETLNISKTGELEEFWKNLPEPWKEYGQLRLGMPSEPTSLLKRHLAARATHVLALYPTDFGTFVWHLLADGSIQSWRLAGCTSSELGRACSLVRRELGNGMGFPAELRATVQDLLGTELSRIPEQEMVCVVPGGALLQFPFAAFPYGDRYLVERNPIAVLPAISLLPYWTSDATAKSSKRAVVIGDSLGDLPEARDEAASVAISSNAMVIVGKAVVRAPLMAALLDCELMHVACHAFYDERDPSRSGFYLADGSIFSAKDFIEGKLRVKVAVLSACESGLLDVTWGDEVGGIAASLLLCGAETVVSTLWRVDDHTSRKLMSVFYDRIAAGLDLARSLAKAQIELLRQNGPGDWAAFQLSGLWARTLGEKQHAKGNGGMLLGGTPWAP